MRLIITFALIAVIFVSNAQIIEGQIKDADTSENIEYASIVLLNGKGTYANSDGKFKLSVKEAHNDTLKISSIGYTSQLIPLSKFNNQKTIRLNILLKTNTETLKEVVINSKKKNYNKKVLLGENKDGNIGFSSLIGYETVIFIPNKKDTKGKLSKVYIDLKRRKNATLTATFNIKFYELDTINNLPGKLLHDKNIYINPKNKKYRLWINVKKLNIKFPKNGICVGVEMVNTFGKVKKHTYFGPMFRYTRSNSREYKIWSNYYNSGWKSGKTKNNNKELHPMIGLLVLYPDE